jgi:hypothetical protein
MLMHEGDAEIACPAGRQGQRYVLAGDAQPPAGVRRVESGQDLDQGRFAGPVLAKQAVDFVGGDREIHTAQGLLATEAFSQAGKLQRWRGHFSFQSFS